MVRQTDRARHDLTGLTWAVKSQHKQTYILKQLTISNNTIDSLAVSVLLPSAAVSAPLSSGRARHFSHKTFTLLPSVEIRGFHLIYRHGHRHYNRPNFHADVAFDTHLPYVQQPLGLHHIRTKLYQLPTTKLRFKHMFKIPLNISWLLSFWMLLSLGCASLFKQFLQKRLPLVIFRNLTSETRVLTPLTLAIS